MYMYGPLSFGQVKVTIISNLLPDRETFDNFACYRKDIFLIRKQSMENDFWKVTSFRYPCVSMVKITYKLMMVCFTFSLLRPQSKRLKGPRFYPVKAVPVDLFPSTNHCELLVLFEREETQS